MTSKDALDNLHRCALCYEPTTCTKEEWVKHCRNNRYIVERDLELLEIIKKYLKINGLSISCFISGNQNSEENFEPRFEELKELITNDR